MTAILGIRAREILDSRGAPTMEAEVVLEDGARGRAAAPAGASTGRYEAKERRDGEERRAGLGVRRAVEAAEGAIQEALRGLDAASQPHVDATLRALDEDGRLGANATLAVSLATARAQARSLDAPLFRHLGGAMARVLPRPMANLINGGAHADNALDFQEFMAVPVSPTRFEDALDMVCEVYAALRARLRARGFGTALGDEGGFAPALGAWEEAWESLVGAVEDAGLRPGNDVAFALDAAASELHADGVYRMPGAKWEGDAQALGELYARMVADWPVISLEDPLDEDDWEGWRALTARLGDKVALVGDDLFATNPARLARGLREGAGNALLVKPNQIGTLTEAFDAARTAQAAGWRVIPSHRSGDTEDPFLADLAVALDAGWIKTGAPARGERTAKYNRLLRIAETLGPTARMASLA